jgi:Predicted glycosyltransferases
MKTLENVSLVVTVKNEGAGIVEFLDAIAGQSMLPAEVIIVDGASRDDTATRVQTYSKMRIQVIIEDCNIARGRNIGIRSAKCDFIVITDAGCIPWSDWIEKICEDRNQADVIVGNYRARILSPLDACQAALMNLFGSDGSLSNFAISSRSIAFQRRIWKQVGGYPEWLKYSEDAYFHDLLKRHSSRIVFKRDAIVEWNQRKSISEIVLQYYRYMEGEAIGRRHLARNLIRYMFYGGSIAALSVFHCSIWLILAIFLSITVYLFVPLRKLSKLEWFRQSVTSSLEAIILLPALLIAVDFAKMSGFASGILQKMKMLRAE